MIRTSNRLFSLDCLRGLDMLLLTVITPIVVAADRSWSLPATVLLALALFGWAVYKDWRLMRSQRADPVVSK